MVSERDDDEISLLVGEGPCGACDHDPAHGYAQINGVWYCHPDENCHDAPLTCYEMFFAVEMQMGVVRDLLVVDEIRSSPAPQEGSTET